MALTNWQTDLSNVVVITEHEGSVHILADCFPKIHSICKFLLPRSLVCKMLCACLFPDVSYVSNLSAVTCIQCWSKADAQRMLMVLNVSCVWCCRPSWGTCWRSRKSHGSLIWTWRDDPSWGCAATTAHLTAGWATQSERMCVPNFSAEMLL
jgi:hypothetical protein